MLCDNCAKEIYDFFKGEADTEAKAAAAAGAPTGRKDLTVGVHYANLPGANEDQAKVAV